MTKKKLISVLLPLVVVGIVLAAMLSREETCQYHKEYGSVFGTTYSITYQYEEELTEDIRQTLQMVDLSLSPFNENSIITQINENKEVAIDNRFRQVFSLAMEVSRETDGAFDITVAPLVNAWGFGFKNGTRPTKEQVDSLLRYVGWQKVTLAGSSVKKENPDIMLDCSAIAKGHAVDAVADMLRSKGIKNFMVEIGGEIVTQGCNAQAKPWKVGIIKPKDDSLSVNSEIQQIIEVNEMAMATSGNYRNYYVENGKKYAHSIDPKTGYPVQHNILSATVFGPTCTIADAYATAFMVLGLDKAQRILDAHQELTAYIIYNDDKGDYKVWHSPKLEELFAK